ncbi:MAG: IS66 family insertion sequence element accessory protein TnpB [Lachnospiraceae bacterium]|nr:IS66 family insertion sequence element accessory protein TnpB [Lachnospiraceae bacterium]
MDECTHNVRAEYWKDIIAQCQQRPSDQSAKQWLDQNGIREQSYYYWQRKFRQQAFDQMNISSDLLPAVKETEKTDFVEISFPLNGKTESSATVPASSMHAPVAMIQTSAFSLAFTNDISEKLLVVILNEVSTHA